MKDKEKKAGQATRESLFSTPHLDDPSATLKAEISVRLTKVRELLGLTGKQLAEATGSTAIGDYERGKSIPGGQVLAALAKLGVNTHWLLTNDGEPLLGGQVAVAHADLASNHAKEPGGHERYEVRVANVMEAMRRAKYVVDAAINEAGFEPSVLWLTVIHELVYSQGLTPAGAVRILETLRSEKEEGG